MTRQYPVRPPTLRYTHAKRPPPQRLSSSSLLKNHFWRLENHFCWISSNQESMGYKDLSTHGAIRNSFFNKLLESMASLVERC